jgi:hypothetical protein
MWQAGKLGGSGGKGSAFSRLYEEAEMMKKRQQDARDRKAKMEEKEMVRECICVSTHREV